MNFSNLKQIIPLLLIIGFFYVLHEFLFATLVINTHSFVYSLGQLYLCFTFFTLLLVFVLIWVKNTSFDNVGMSFLLATSVKMLFCFLIVRPVVRLSGPENLVQKLSFFAIFSFFLLIETIFTILLVNQKKK